MESANLEELLTTRFTQSMTIPEQFFSHEAEQIARACWDMARRFHQGGRLLAFGNGACATDAQHISVEFVHPVIVGKRALPALALTNDSATMSGLAASKTREAIFMRQLQMLARPHDIAIGFSLDGNSSDVRTTLSEAHRRGLLTLGLSGGDGGQLAQMALDYCFTIPSHDSMVIQETHETLYHVLWELVHIFFEHEGMLK